MSYILDALKKSQSARQNDQVSLNLSGPVRRIPTWLSFAMAGLVTANVALLVWIFVLKAPSSADPGVDQPNDPAHAQAPTEQISNAETEPTTTDARPAANGLANLPPTNQQDNSPTNPVSSPRADPAAIARQPAPAPLPNPETSTPLTKYQLSELAAAERARFEALTYTTHIYTDDPDLCAIVINGQRLTQGDSIEGLLVDEITPEGVIFHERNDGRGRLVEVSVIAQWES